MNDTDGAKEDFTHALEDNPASIHTWLKMANIHLDHSNVEESFNCFEKALSYDPKDADVYFHRGQGRVSTPSSEWDLNRFHSPICPQPTRQGGGRLRSFNGTRQQLRLQSHSAGCRPLQSWRGNKEHGRVPQNYEELPSAQRTSELLVGLILAKAIALPDSHLSGEVLLDQQRFQDAIEKFDRAIELERAKL